MSDSTALNSETIKNLHHHTLLKLSWFNIKIETNYLQYHIISLVHQITGIKQSTSNLIQKQFNELSTE